MTETIELLKFIFREISISTFILFIVATFLFYIAWHTQSRKDFDFADMLRNGASRKPSGTRLASLVCLIFTSWGLVYAFLTVLGKATLDKDYFSFLTSLFGIYMGIWSGSKVVEKAIDAWSLWKSGGVPPAQPGNSTSTLTTTTSVRNTQEKPKDE